MGDVIFGILFLAICGLLFGKADTKRVILGLLGLDLSKDNYEQQKKSEFRKYSIRAMKTIVDFDEYHAENEREFLSFMSYKLENAVYSNKTLDGIGHIYIKQAWRVIERRRNDVKAGNNTSLENNMDFSKKKSAKKYCTILWNKYQYPWPDDWLQRDGI